MLTSMFADEVRKVIDIYMRGLLYSIPPIGNRNCVPPSTGLCPNSFVPPITTVRVGDVAVEVVLNFFSQPLVCVRVHAAKC